MVCHSSKRRISDIHNIQKTFLVTIRRCQWLQLFKSATCFEDVFKTSITSERRFKDIFKMWLCLFLVHMWVLFTSCTGVYLWYCTFHRNSLIRISSLLVQYSILCCTCFLLGSLYHRNWQVHKTIYTNLQV